MKKIWKSKLTIAVGLLSCLSVAWSLETTSTSVPPATSPAQASEDQHPEKLFETYPKSKFADDPNDAFSHFVEGHLNAKSHLQAKHLIYATWFDEGRQNVAIQSFLREDGTFNHWCYIWNWAYHGGGFPQHVDATKMKLIKQTLKDVPLSDPHPPLSKLLIFSFQRDSKWLTRTFDKDKLPASVARTFQLLGRSLDASS